MVRFALEPARRASRPRRPSCSPRTSPPSRAAAPASEREGAGIDTEVSLRVPGRHNVANALAALGGLSLASADVEACARALADFPGVARRLELKGEADGARIYDDYAHHPTEVAATLEAARDLEPAAADRRLPAPPLLPHQGAGHGVRRGPGRRRRGRRARRLSGPRGAGGRARGRERHDGRERRRGPWCAGAASGGCPTAELAAQALRPRLGGGRRPDHDRRRRRLQARRGTGRTGARADERAGGSRARLSALAADHRQGRAARRTSSPARRPRSR